MELTELCQKYAIERSEREVLQHVTSKPQYLRVKAENTRNHVQRAESECGCMNVAVNKT